MSVYWSGFTLPLGATSGLQTNAGALSLLIGDTSLHVVSSVGLEVNLATDPGLVVSSGLAIQLQTVSGLVLGASGLAANPDGVTITINGSNQLVASGVGGVTVLYSAVNSSAIANTTTPTSFSLSFTPTTGALNTADRKLRFKCYFSVKATNSAADTLTLKLLLGSTAIAIMSLIPVGGVAAGTPMECEINMTVTATGSSGSVQTDGILFFDGLYAVLGLPTTTTSSINLTSSLALAVQATWSTASANDSVTLDDITIEQLA